VLNKLVISEEKWHKLQEHLLQNSNEHLAFGLARYAKVGHNHILLVRDLILIQDNHLETGNTWHGLSLKLEALLEVMNKANKEELVLVEVHSHPFSVDNVGFSYIDMRGQRELFVHLQEVSPGRPYGAIIIGQNAVKGLLWIPGMKRPVHLQEVRVLGDSIQSIPPSRVFRKNRHVMLPSPEVSSPYHRQILALGKEGQCQLERVMVGIVGLGGIGSIVALELAYLGLNHIILVDDDSVEITNLNRLVGATAKEVGKPKVEVARDVFKSIKPNASVTLVKASIRSSEALKLLKGADIIVGCVDTDSGRMILNELALAYMIPLIDCGAGIEVRDGHIIEIGGRVIVWMPGRPCLLCAKEFVPRIAAEELESPEEKEFRQRHGYIAGADVKEPAVISLNGTVASIAVSEFLALVTGFKPSQHYTYYDMLEQRVVPRIVSKDRMCTACALEGIGDKASIDRYSRQGLPCDIPRI